MESKSNDNSEVSSNVDTRIKRLNSSEIDTYQCPSVKLHGAPENEPIPIYECLVCEQTANGGKIVCEECSEWYKFSCIALPESRVDLIPNDVPFICQFCTHSSFAIISMGKKEFVALLCLSFWCLVIVAWLFLTMLWVCI